MYPIMLNLQGKKIVLVGGGKIALKKTKDLVDAGGRVTVVAPNILAEFYTMTKVTLIHSCYEKKYIEKAQLIFACTDSKQVNQQIVRDCEIGQWINDCSEKEHSDFFNMATIKQENYLYALSSFGKNPKKLKVEKENLEKIIRNQKKFS